ncbi:hypothetical protein CR513_57154, partial [Mucuna pruriens]
MTLANQNTVGYAQADYVACPPPHNTRTHLMACCMVGTRKTLSMKNTSSRMTQKTTGLDPWSNQFQSWTEWGDWSTYITEPEGSTPSITEHYALQDLQQVPQSKEKWQSLEERLYAVEGGDRYGLEVVDLCLVPDVGLPANFKTLEFDKYKGSSCPRVHLAMYCRKMAAYIYDDKVLIHYFQDSLTRATLIWYASLERGRVKTRRDLVEAFLKQYKYNEDMAPDHFRLQTMVKKEQEGFKEYAQRWRELVVQVQPPITEMEMVTMFIDTLPSPYYDKVVGNVASNFAELVVVGERIELGIP